MFNTQRSAMRPDISAYDTIRRSIRDSENADRYTTNSEAQSYKEETMSSVDGTGTSFREGMNQTIQTFKRFLEEIKKSTAIVQSANDSWDRSFGNLSLKYRRTLSIEDVEATFVTLVMKKATKKDRRNWCEDEIKLLIHIVRYYCIHHRLSPVTMSEEHWKFISQLLPKRHSEICKEKWMSIHQIHVHDAPWTSQEDDLLVKLIQKYGVRKWTQISRELNQQANSSAVFRQAKQCRERWINHLDPSINKGSWTYEEDLCLLRAIVSIGRKWSEISKRMVNRTENSVKNRWKSLLKKYKEQLNITSIAVGNSPTYERIIAQKLVHLVCNEMADPRATKESEIQSISQPKCTPEPDIFGDICDENEMEEDIAVNQVRDSLVRSGTTQTFAMCKQIQQQQEVDEEANINFLNNYFNQPIAEKCGGMVDIENSFSQLNLQPTPSVSDQMMARSLRLNTLCNQQVDLAIKPLQSTQEDLGNLEVCLYDGKNVYKAFNPLQKKALDIFVRNLFPTEMPQKPLQFTPTPTMKIEGQSSHFTFANIPNLAISRQNSNFLQAEGNFCDAVSMNEGERQVMCGGDNTNKEEEDIMDQFMRNDDELFGEEDKLFINQEKGGFSPRGSRGIFDALDSPISKLCRGASAFFN